MGTLSTITIVGLGPGSGEDLTLRARELFALASANGQTVHFRTFIHPTIDFLRQLLPDLQMQSFDHFYDESDNWETLYDQIATTVCDLAVQQSILYAVPGHPLVGEISVQTILRLARERGLNTEIVAGLSFLEPVFTALDLDPFDVGTQIIDATTLAALDVSVVAGRVIPTIPLLITQVYNRRVASAVKLALGELYNDEWPVILVRAAGVDSEEQVIKMPLYELDRQHLANHLCTLYVPPVDELSALRVPETLRYITMRLRREPDGCPWDRKQTHQSLTKYVVEEAYEVVEAIEEADMEKLSEELGDLLLQVYLHSEVARQNGEFHIGDVFEQVSAKLIRRHPHVFGAVDVDSADQVVRNWEEIKKQERADAGKDVHQESALDRVPQNQPALLIAQEYQKRAAKTGFEFQNQEELLAKFDEELHEFVEAGSPTHRQEEFGDLLWMLIRVGQAYKIDAEEALRGANRKFKARFQKMEALAAAQGRTLSSYSIEEMLGFWQQAKLHA